MNFSVLAKNLERFAVANSPAILTGIAVTGTVATAVLAGKASFKAAKIIAGEEEKLKDRMVEVSDEEEGDSDSESTLDTKQKTLLVWKLYIPAASTCVTTVMAMIAANQIGTRRTAAMAAAYSLSEKAFGEYREKIVEKMGPKKEEAARTEIAQERVARTPVPSNQVVISGNDVLCFDQHSGRYFHSTMEELKKSQNDTNYRIINDGYQSLNDFYERIGLDMVPTGEELGWNTDTKFELYFSTVLSPDQRPCIAIEFVKGPITNYYKVH
ncbi:gp054 [Rhodococcus phage ReqiPoco6]|uniref:Gp054 n=1 Tax=Rhodococcus phage ReqiPoco6 TaxID=691964 RepID=D4P7S2_9CAUD|nr:gp054 [Rhodococcus phage ReqiPoco6]ADD81052.1 gp054 [Rhodococcus phage ReqiPoco6]